VWRQHLSSLVCGKVRDVLSLADRENEDVGACLYAKVGEPESGWFFGRRKRRFRLSAGREGRAKISMW